ncbi:SNF2 helicase associated domain-containing protein [Fictibacillus terranigra]|uniref:SNF2 helicase associated domain-containing protein n=1 Tax=Fictibacillus terranigra TaxID=3058424 RepID=A0ABT8E8C1_9BACL|nr:SNF2 helicase associated domain-containing protein [Fictibacillus sp. CENA-BCM004]MDN4074152.1 SNF2 helicase associated domain-containing protein [Fictibacillus sp. CENA-BCM004]
MNIKLNQSIIKEKCGTVSFKKGDSFYRADKVNFDLYSADNCKATVTGTEDFHVTIECEPNGSFRSECSCPTLASFQKDCQHVAAVLLMIYHHQERGTNPVISGGNLAGSLVDQELTEDFLSLFHDQPKPASKHQLHFEKRQVLDVGFTCKPVEIGKGQTGLAISVKIGPVKVQHIRDFLKRMEKGSAAPLSLSFTYEPIHHCFEKENDEVLRHLTKTMHDEQVYMYELFERPNGLTHNDLLFINPSSWEGLLPLLEKAPIVKMEYGSTHKQFQTSKEPLNLQFDFEESKEKDYQLKIEGLSQMAVLPSYRSVLSEGRLFPLKSDDCARLSELKRMLDASRTNIIPISQKQMGIFLEKVIPGLKRLGLVQVSRAITEQFASIPLVAKLYLDRVKNRLLAGLEFQYDHIVIDPLERRAHQENSKLIRDVEKEELILELMEKSSFAKTDGGYFLNNEELEYEFLYHVVPKLQKFVQIYATTAVRNRMFRENARPQIRVKLKKERTNWLEFKFAIDGIPEGQIRDVLLALEEKRKYYRLRNGALLSLETREFEEIQRFLHALPVPNHDLEKGLELPFIQGMQMLDAAEDHMFELEKSFLQFLEELRNPDSLEFEVPRDMEPILRDYQRKGYQWMKTLARYGFGGILADDMGLGKTLQSITFIESVLQDIRAKKSPVLIVCPSSLTYNWLSEIKKFAPDLQAVVADGDKTERFDILKQILDHDVIITSYPLLRKDIGWYEKLAFHTVFFDEAQAFKNPVTQTARAVKKIRADHRFALTGTPVENALEELWSIFHVVFPELLRGLKEFSHLSRKTINRRISPFLLRRLKEDVLMELPEKTESLESVELLPEQKKLYAAYLAKLRHDTLKHLDRDTLRKNRIKILAGLTRLRQICCHPALFVDSYKGASAKFTQLMQIVEESKLSGRRVLIFSQFTKMLELVGRELANKGLPFFYLDGQTPSMERVALCNRFNAGERDFFLISLKAGGTGLNLTGADTVILYDIWWNPAVEDQAADRAHRMGQANAVQVIKLVARGTIEEKMNELQERKKDLIGEIIGTGEKSSSSLTEEDIREILML